MSGELYELVQQEMDEMIKLDSKNTKDFTERIELRHQRYIRAIDNKNWDEDHLLVLRELEKKRDLTMEEIYLIKDIFDILKRQ